jgi:hypothetical protein
MGDSSEGCIGCTTGRRDAGADGSKRNHRSDCAIHSPARLSSDPPRNQLRGQKLSTNLNFAARFAGSDAASSGVTALNQSTLRA